MNKPEDTVIDDIGRALAEDVQRPSPEFEAKLGRRVREGFPRERRLPRFKLQPLPVAGALASLLVALVIAVGIVQNGDEESASGGAGGAPEVQLQNEEGLAGSRSAPSVASGEPAPPMPPDGDFDPGREQRIERSAALTLAAPADELDKVGDGVVAIADRHRGFVLRSSLTSGEEGGGTFELRIPVGELRQSLRELSALADVRSRTQSGQDVTRQFTSARERLVEARAERRSLLRRLERADSDREAGAIRSRLEIVRAQIRGHLSQLRDLRLRTDYASVSVTVEESSDDGSGTGFGATGDALRDSLDTLGGVINVALRALGVLLPLGLLAGTVALGARTLRRRRREAVLAE